MDHNSTDQVSLPVQSVLLALRVPARFLVCFVACLGYLVLGASPVDALVLNSLTLTPGIDGGTCTTSSLRANVNIDSPDNDAGSGFDNFVYVVRDALGNIIATRNDDETTGSTGVPNVSPPLQILVDAAGLGGVTAPVQRPFTIQVYDTASGGAPFALGALLGWQTFDPVAAPSSIASCAGLQLGASSSDLEPALQSILESSLRVHDWAIRNQVVSRLFDEQDGASAGNSEFTGMALAPMGAQIFGMHSAQLKDMLRSERNTRSADVVLAQAQRTEGTGSGTAQSGGGSSGQSTTSTPLQTYAQSALSLWFSGAVSGSEFDRPVVGFDGHVYHARVGGDWKPRQGFVIGLFGAYDRAETETRLDNTELDGNAYMGGGYFGLKLARRLLLDGSIGYGTLDYEFRGDFNAGKFDAERTFATLGLTGFANIGPVNLRPRFSYQYAREKKDAYVDAAGFPQPSRTARVEKLEYGTELRSSRTGAFQPYLRIFGEYDGARKFDNSAASIGAGFSAQLSEQKVLQFEYSQYDIGRSDLDSCTVFGRLAISLQ